MPAAGGGTCQPCVWAVPWVVCHVSFYQHQPLWPSLLCGPLGARGFTFPYFASPPPPHRHTLPNVSKSWLRFFIAMRHCASPRAVRVTDVRLKEHLRWNSGLETCEAPGLRLCVRDCGRVWEGVTRPVGGREMYVCVCMCAHMCLCVHTCVVCLCCVHCSCYLCICVHVCVLICACVYTCVCLCTMCALCA